MNLLNRPSMPVRMRMVVLDNSLAFVLTGDTYIETLDRRSMTRGTTLLHTLRNFTRLVEICYVLAVETP